VVISNPSLAKQMLKKIEEFPKRPPRIQFSQSFAKLFGTKSILNVNQPEWHDQRVLLNKAFTSNKVFFHPMQKKALQCIQLWRNGKPANVGDDLQKMTLDVLATCIFGNDFNTLNGNMSGPLDAYNYTVKNMIEPIRFIFPFLNNLPLASNKKLKESMSVFDDYCWSIINDAKKNSSPPKEEQQNPKIVASDDTDQPYSLVKMMIESGMTDQNIRDNVGVFFPCWS